MDVTEVAARWRTARRLYPIYSQINRSFNVGVEPCRDLESPIDRSEADVLERVDHWFLAFDERVQPHQLRQVLQTTQVATPENLRELLNRQLSHPVKHLAVRDKADYLIVQYYAHCAPAVSQLRSPTFSGVGEILSEILGDVSPKPPAFAGDLDAVTHELDSCSGLAELLRRRIIERVRELKDKHGAAFFAVPALIAFARSNYLLRHALFRLLQADLALIRLGLQELADQGFKTIDCSSAGLSSEEPLDSLMQTCDAWRNQFLAEYAPEKNFRQLLQILNAISVALNERSRSPVTAVVQEEIRAAPERAPPVVTPIQAPPRRTTTFTTAAVNLKLEDYIDQIADYLITVTMAAPEMMTIMLGNIRLMLASWEVDAFVHLQDEVAIAIQRGVAARLMLEKACELKRQTGFNLAPALALAHAEAAVMQERIAEAKDRQDIDGAGRLAATDKRLLFMIEDTEKL